MKNTWAGLLAAVGLAVGVWGGASCDTADEIFDCQSVCSRYQSCFDQKYDVGACRSRCKEKSDQDREYRRKADACETCIDDRACAETPFKCGVECSAIVP